MFGFLNPVKNITNQYCECVKYAHMDAKSAYIEMFPFGDPLTEFNIEKIFDFLLKLKGCAMTEGQKEIIRLAKKEVLSFKGWSWLPIYPRDIAWFLTRTNLIYYHWTKILTLNNISIIDTAIKKHFGI